jgi:hypothetical protein
MEITVDTLQGSLTGKILKDKEQAESNGYEYYFTNDDGIDIYKKHLDKYHCKFGFILKLQIPKVGSMYRLSDGGNYLVAACDKHHANDYALVRPTDGYMFIAHNAVIDSDGIISWDFSKKGHFIFD